MNRIRLNFVIDAIGFVGFIFLAVTGILMRYVLPPGSGHHTLLWGLDRHEWGALHFWIAVGFFGVLILHLFLHWRWIMCVICGQPSEKSGIRFILGLIGLIGILGFALAPFWSTVEHTSGPAHIPSSARTGSYLDHGGNEIKGRMTLSEIERATGIPCSYMIKRLGLPEDVSTEIGIARLGKQYGFDISDVRRIVAEY